MKTKISVMVFLVALLAIALPNLVFALKNPAEVYCSALGYEYVVESTPEGELGICKLQNGQEVDAWQFLRGEVAQESSYCSKQGYQIKTISDWDKCVRLLSQECAVCVLDDGEEVEVTRLMGLHFEETICGDGTCGVPENFSSCPKDCPSGSLDGYCDKMKDNICDPDCRKAEDPDCEEVTSSFYIAVGIVLILVIGLIASFLLKQRKRKKSI
ncbi:MAG: DUF333 domain-containing protein [Candidatus Parvarchaeota archaeon]|nr:DUF333 domain-containing protein [Candidatus Jingweiarchaeum tengchongense]MCW1298211.1 DUF333 domain-containing protein [Candidatus Jingweiarchaeum tengchongense]MCW1300009.1 DUF333 domain-containing protein [Candidatus Jingweiarchaeum tengchongense]MCW1305442.1 DUF333 domain-containing protein [Candidatus Jingweiarchaeum tengchongense]MCW1309206.1 DUF333 domain-containing protein [Candidatus Jingweiarchaeum tengchongense]